MRSAAMVFGRDSIDIGTRDADIGKLAVSQVQKLAPDRLMALPSLVKPSNRSKHDSVLFFPGVSSESHDKYKFQCALHIKFAAVQLGSSCMPENSP